MDVAAMHNGIGSGSCPFFYFLFVFYNVYLLYIDLYCIPSSAVTVFEYHISCHEYRQAYMLFGNKIFSM